MKLKILFLLIFTSSIPLSARRLLAVDENEGGKCYGICGPNERECDEPATPNCGNNPTADSCWKRMTKAECTETPKHPDANVKYFKADK